MYQYFPTARNADLVVQEADSEVLVYDLVSNKAHYLNETSAMIWQSCNGKNSVGQISAVVSNKTGFAVSDDLIWMALNDLSKSKLLENKVEMPAEVSGMSRRDMVKKVGLRTMIALPVIASLVAPMAIHANSACVTVIGGCTCNARGTQGMSCTPVVPCGDATNCNCVHNNSGNTNGNCVP